MIKKIKSINKHASWSYTSWIYKVLTITFWLGIELDS